MPQTDRSRSKQDSFLMAAQVCFVVAPLGGFLLMIGVERPTRAALQDSYQPHGGSGPGHLIPGAEIMVIRWVFSVGLMILGSMLGILGSARLNRRAASSSKLRDRTWIMLIAAVILCLALETL